MNLSLSAFAPPAPRLVGKVAPIFLQCLILVLGILVGDLGVAAQFAQRLENVGHCHLQLVLLGEGQEKMFGADVLVLELVRVLLRRIQSRAQVTTEILLTGPVDLGTLVQQLINPTQLGIRILPKFLQQGTHKTFRLLDQRQQQVRAVHLLMV